MDESDSEEPLVDLVGLGSDLVGGVGGAGLGLFVAGPAGVIAGPAAGIAASHALRGAAAEIKRRWLSRRQEERVGGVLGAAVAEFERRMAAGEAPRADGFFEDLGEARSVADEVIEHALLVAKDEDEERKIVLLGRLTAGICFDSTITREQANNLLRTAERLSYRQLLMLQLFSSPTPRPGFRPAAYRDESRFSLELIHVLDEINDLCARGLLTNGPDVALGITDVVPADVATQGIGAQMFNLMRLGLLEDLPSLDRLRRILSEDQSPSVPPA